MRHILIVAGLLLFSGCTSVDKTGEPTAGPVQSEIHGQLKALEPGTEASDSFPVVIRQVQPIYPSGITGKKIGGKAVIEFIVEIDGTVHITRVVSQTAEGFGVAASTCVKEWFFKPGLKGGVPVRCAMIVPFEFAPQ